MIREGPCDGPENLATSRLPITDFACTELGEVRDRLTIIVNLQTRSGDGSRTRFVAEKAE
jgi:hypothetical protein